jgi:hypothetical protein
MEFKSQYLQAMRDRAPQMFKELTKSGELLAFAEQKTKEAHRLFRELLRQNRPEGKDGKPSLRQEREAEEQVKAQLFEFPSAASLDPHTEKDELRAMLGTRPILPPRL